MTLASLELMYILLILKDFSALMLSKSSLPIRCTTEETLIILDGADCFSLSEWEGMKKKIIQEKLLKKYIKNIKKEEEEEDEEETNKQMKTSHTNYPAIELLPLGQLKMFHILQIMEKQYTSTH